MGSSKKHKEKDRDREERKHKHKDKDRDREERRHRHKDKDRDRDRDREKKRDEDRSRRKRRKSESDDEGPPPIRIKQEKPEHDRGGGSPPGEEAGASASGGGGGGDGMSLSIEETNKLRIKLGLKPLEVTDSEKKGDGEAEEKPYDKRDDVHRPAVNLAEERKRQEIREKMELIRQKRRINQKLNKVKSIAEYDDDDELDNALVWVQKSRKLQQEKEKAEKTARLLEEMDEEFGIGNLVENEFGTEEKRRQQAYTATNLRGLTVQHSKDSFKDGQSVVLTLEDRDVLEEGDDMLMNVNIAEYEKAAKNVELKKKKPGYNPYDEPEFDEFGMVKQKALLSKYDEEIEGEKKQSFVLGGGGGVSLEHDREMEKIRQELKQNAFQTLDIAAPSLATEYYTHEEMTAFKKPKKRRRKIRKLKAEDLVPEVDSTSEDHGSRSRIRGSTDSTNHTDLQNTGQEAADMDVDFPSVEESEILGPPEEERYTVVEDDAQLELQIALEKSRRVKQKKDAAKGAEKVAEVVSATRDEKSDSAMDGADTSRGMSIVLNATSEFCRTLGEIPTYGTSGNRETNEDEMVDIDREEEEKQNMEDEDEEAVQGWSAVNLEAERRANLKEEDAPILEDEPQITSGIAGALLVAQKKGYLDKEEESAKIASKAKRGNIEARSYTIEDKNYHEEDSKHSRYNDKYRGPVVEFREKEDYKPDVKVHYHDETGRDLNQKEAFRVLSHRFHGKGSGKMKTEKRSKKLQDELMMLQMSSTDTPLNTVARLQEKQKQLQTPFLVLSGGGKTLEENTMIKK
ncbi:U4/U6.U5 tri-snRNP-associated protein 1-like isoform X2 [Ptychodera flava]|uniref:U4/U6.U5 tri-snRNP-associated protein 1-like isoform X2 n=1 Tax=Ptychodera flava TaxID=63121 RepID=UPI00396A83A5